MYVPWTRRLAQIQIAEQLFDGWDTQHRALQSDATSKFGYSYSTFDISLDEEKKLVASLRDMAGGDSET